MPRHCGIHYEYTKLPIIDIEIDSSLVAQIPAQRPLDERVSLKCSVKAVLLIKKMQAWSLPSVNASEALGFGTRFAASNALITYLATKSRHGTYSKLKETKIVYLEVHEISNIYLFTKKLSQRFLSVVIPESQTQKPVSQS